MYVSVCVCSSLQVWCTKTVSRITANANDVNTPCICIIFCAGCKWLVIDTLVFKPLVL